MIKFYYEIEYKNGSHMGRHNCTGVKIKGNKLVVKGLDMLHDFDGEYEHYW